MEVVSIGFVGSVRPSHAIIQTATLSPWAHCWANLSDGSIIDATASHGVAQRERADYPWAWRYTQPLRRSSCEQRRTFCQLLLAQRGRPYDYDWLWGFPLHRRWQDDDAWVCSELIAAAAVSAKILQPLKLHRITPGRLLEELQQL